MSFPTANWKKWVWQGSLMYMHVLLNNDGPDSQQMQTGVATLQPDWSGSA